MLILGLDALWLDEDSICAHQTWIVKRPIEKGPNQIQFLFWGEYIIQKIDGEVALIHRYRRPFPGRRLVLLVENWSIHGLSINEAASKNLEKLDLEAEIKRLKQQASCETITNRAQPFPWARIPKQYR